VVINLLHDALILPANIWQALTNCGDGHGRWTLWLSEVFATFYKFWNYVWSQHYQFNFLQYSVTGPPGQLEIRFSLFS